jgi:hypothetical protein
MKDTTVLHLSQYSDKASWKCWYMKGKKSGGTRRRKSEGTVEADMKGAEREGVNWFPLVRCRVHWLAVVYTEKHSFREIPRILDRKNKLFF